MKNTRGEGKERKILETISLYIGGTEKGDKEEEMSESVTHI